MKKVSIIIPCRNEEKFIGKCLDSIAKQDYPKEDLEVLVVDGMSSDKTKEVIEKSKTKNPELEIKILDNPKKITPVALNIGIKNAEGEIIIRMDAHAGYGDNYVSKCIESLEKYRADNVGGAMKTLPSENILMAKSIALCLSHFFGAGGSTFRVNPNGSVDKPREVDTVFGGCYKKDVFQKIGLFNENLVRSQDMEFNLRLKRAGGKIILNPEIVSYYYPKPSLRDFFFHNVQDGFWSVYPLKFVKMPFKLRHYIPFIFVSSLLVAGVLGIFFGIFSQLFNMILSAYFFAALYFSTEIAIREKDGRYFFTMPVVFFARHFGYGLGSIMGLIKVIKK